MHLWKHASSFAVGLVIGTALISPGVAVSPSAADSAGGSRSAAEKSPTRSALSPPARQSDQPPGTGRRVVDITEQELRVAAFQKTCPACQGALLAKQTPCKTALNMFFCSPKCQQEFHKFPRLTVNRWLDICEARAKEYQNEKR
jgi:hypothetical protein